MKRSYLIITILLFVLSAMCFIYFEAMHAAILEDAIANKLLCGFISRFSLSLFFGWLLYITGGRSLMIFNKNSLRLFAWSLPCFMVAFINFPYSAIINKTATIVRTDLIGLFILYVLSVALLEEFIFRGVIIVTARDYFRNKRHAPLIIVLISAIVFSLFHLTNLIEGADVGSVLLQCGYTFLIGAMLAVTVLRTKSIWICVAVHAIFDFGGLLIAHIGSGSPWDTVFWILTIVSGVLCAGHIIYSLIKLEKDYVS